MLTFSNANGNAASPGVESGSLADGRWQLAIPTLNYLNPLNGTCIRRLFGDFDGNGTVDGSADFAAFGNRFGITL